MLPANRVIVKNPEILGGTPVFRGTRVPVQALFDYLGGGETIEDSLVRVSWRNRIEDLQTIHPCGADAPGD
jgi:hypothetical protein